MSVKEQVKLYLVTDRTLLTGESLKASVEAAISGGVTMVQLREKHLSSKEFYELAIGIKEITDKYNVPLIINDRLDIALAINASGVHIGQEDLPASIVKKLIGPDKIVGVSAATLAEAAKAEQDGVDYIGVGSFYPTKTKTDTRNVTIDQLREISEKITIPIVAIGGINHTNAEVLLDNGADGIAVVSAILASNNQQKAATILNALVNK
jgi:thiamine-phosphate pyrophosphorylase